MSKPQFTTKDLLIATALIAVGAGLLSYLFRLPHVFDASPTGMYSPQDESGAWVQLWIGAGAAIGAGIATPFKRPIAGALVGAAIQMALIVPLLMFMESLIDL